MNVQEFLPSFLGVQPALKRPDVPARRLALGQHRLDLAGVFGVDGDVPKSHRKRRVNTQYVSERKQWYSM